MAGAVVTIGVMAALILLPRDAARIKRQFTFLAENIAKARGESPLIAAAKAKRVREVFTDRVAILATPYGYSREVASAELPALILSARALYSEIALAFYDEQIDFPQERLANVRVTGRLRGRLLSGERVEDIQELICKFQEIDGNWHITAIEVVEVLQP